METDLEFFERLMKDHEMKMKDKNENKNEIIHIINPLQVKKVIANKPKKDTKMKMVFE
uniref:Uncharacterized protein n=1 Tax=viral metagenome TaxID=1070528 RepID=A0A6C0CPS2_9ZZZZ